MAIRPQEDQQTLRKLLRELRIAKGYKQSEVAEKTGFSLSTVSKYELGEKRLDVLELRTVCAALDISLREFVNLLETRLDSNDGGQR